LPSWDYISPGLRDPQLKRLFPRMVAGDRTANAWPYLRAEIPHTWYVDARFSMMGFLSLDEAALLHALARPFAGKPALEIGCWRGWSTAHLLSAGVVLDVIDPILADEAVREELWTIARGLEAGERATLHGTRSADGIAQAAGQRGQPWSFAFIDGDHEPPSPVLDAVKVASHAADDAMIVFHDLASPYVAAGLDALRDLGWSTLVYQTMQIMGVAWRGAAAPVAHVPDSRVSWTIPEHLETYPFSGEDERTRDERFGRVLARHSALVRELALARDIAAAIPDRAGGITLSSVWERAAAGPPDAPPLPISVTGKRLFEALASTRTALFEKMEEVEAELRAVRLDHAGALEAVYGLCAERADARTEIDRLSKELAGALRAVDVREAEQTLLRDRADELVVELQTARARLADLETARAGVTGELEAARAELQQARADLARTQQQVMDLAPFANRAGRTQAAILRLLRRAHLFKGVL
jgi:predicted O-methyltransferase YrrM